MAKGKKSGRGGARPNAGAPLKTADKLDRTIAVRVSQQIAEMIKLAAAEKGLHPADFIRSCIEKWLKNE